MYYATPCFQSVTIWKIDYVRGKIGGGKGLPESDGVKKVVEVQYGRAMNDRGRDLICTISTA